MSREWALLIAVPMLLLLLVVASGILATQSHRTLLKNPLAQRQKAAWRAFRSIGMSPSGEPLANPGLIGETAVVLAKAEQLPSTDGEDLLGPLGMVELQLHVRNHDGQGFFVIARSDSTTFVKPIDEGVLKAILKDRYRPPAPTPT